MNEVGWTPKTKLGRLVYEGRITTIEDALATNLPLKEVEIVDILVPNMQEEVLDVNLVQRMTDSGRRTKFSVTVAVGNGDGVVGIGRAKGKEVGPAIKKAIDRAKLNLIIVARGCGSWECGCGQPHTLPYRVTGKAGSVRITLKPAPKGVGLAVGDIAKVLLRLAGIKDAWGFARGHTRTTVNYALAVFDALRQTSLVKINPKITIPLHYGGVGVVRGDQS